MNDYFTFAEILVQTQRIFESDASKIANHNWTPTENVRLCTDLKFDFEAQKWTDDKMGLQIFSFIDS